MEHRSISNRARGFTLIELLVVIAIIAILAAILFPVVMAVINKSHQSACQSNVRQLGMAVANYAQDWSETYPAMHASDGRWYPELLSSYIRNKKIWECPTSKLNVLGFANYPYRVSYGVACTRDLPVSQSPPGVTAMASYCVMNPPDITWWNPNLKGLPAKLSDVSHPTKVIIMGDSNAYTWGPDPWIYIFVTNAQIFADYYLPKWHNGGASYMFADGHSKWLQPRQACAYYWRGQ